MKKILLLILMLTPITGFAYDAKDVYEISGSTFIAEAASISTSTPVLVSRATSALRRTDGYSPYRIFSTTIQNLDTSTMAYTLSGSATVAPSLTCANGAIIGAGSASGPFNLTEQFEGLYMWVIGCGSTPSNIRKVLRGKFF